MMSLQSDEGGRDMATSLIRMYLPAHPWPLFYLCVMSAVWPSCMKQLNVTDSSFRDPSEKPCPAHHQLNTSDGFCMTLCFVKEEKLTGCEILKQSELSVCVRLCFLPWRNDV